jgi:hypothetical protein
MKPVLRKEWISRIFDRLRGVYGSQFKAKFSSVEDGVDVGMLNAMTVWSEELGVFGDHSECIVWALENLPVEHAPNAMEFRDLCRRAPRKPAGPQIEYQHIPADPERAKEVADKAKAALANDRDHMAWAKYPASREAFDALLAAAKRDTRLREIVDQHVANGVCDEQHKLLTIRKHGEWVKA